MLKLQLQSDKGAPWLGWAKVRLFALSELRKKLRVSFIKRTYQMPDKIMVQVISSDICDIIKIWGGQAGGFIFTPRFGTITDADFTRVISGPQGLEDVIESHPVLAGYALNGSEQIEIIGTHAAFPVTDEEYQDVRRTLTREEAEWSQQTDTPYLAGNIDWIGPNSGEADSTAEVLTWKGPPGRHIPLDPTMNIAGLSVFDEVVNDIGYYTPFGPNVYQGGEVYATLPEMGKTPPKVLGAAFCGGKLLVIAGVNYRGLDNPDGGTGGFYDEIWTNSGGWRRLGHKPGSRPYLPWFFNQSGTAATNQAGRFEINPENEAVQYIEHESAGSGSVTEQREPDYSVSKSGAWRRYYEYKGDTLVWATISLTSSDSSQHETLSHDPVTGAVPWKIQADPNRSIAISGTRTPVVGSTYSAIRGCCGTWSGSGLSLDASGKVTAITGCGCGKVIYTDKDGRVGQYAVKLPGVWIQIDYDTCSCPLYGSICTISDAFGDTDPLTTYDDAGCAIRKVTGAIACVNTAHPDCAACVQVDPAEVRPGACAAWFECSGSNPRWLGRTVYEWQCP